jgi:hypothetical protein
VLVDMDRVVGALAGSADEKCSLHRRLYLDQFPDRTTPLSALPR